MEVNYSFRFDYRFDPLDGMRYPILTLELVNPDDLTRRVEVDAYIDCGCSKSLFDGRLANLIGIDPTRGPLVSYTSASGVSVAGILCSVQLQHPDLGRFDVEVGFAQVRLKRNLLGRDFLAHIQLGIREYRQEFFVRAEP